MPGLSISMKKQPQLPTPEQNGHTSDAADNAPTLNLEIPLETGGAIRLVYVPGETVAKAQDYFKQLEFHRAILRDGDVNVFVPDVARVLENMGLNPRSTEKAERAEVDAVLASFRLHYNHLRQQASTESLFLALCEDAFSTIRRGSIDWPVLRKGIQGDIPDGYFDTPPTDPFLPAPVVRKSRLPVEQRIALLTGLMRANPNFLSDLETVAQRVQSTPEEEVAQAVDEAGFQPG